jgi:hypothetical protein
MRQNMSGVEVKDRYMTLKVEYAGIEIEARWRGGHYINFYEDDREFACTWQDQQVSDAETFEVFVLETLPDHFGI